MASNSRRSAPAANRQQRIVIGVVVLLAVLTFSVVAYARTAPSSGTSSGPAAWIWNNPSAALAKAKAEHKPLLIDFWASWCVWCKKMDDETYTDPQVTSTLTSKYVTLKIDVDKLPGFQQQFNAQSLPTTVVLDSSGKEVGRLVGFRPPAQFIPFLEDPGAQPHL